MEGLKELIAKDVTISNKTLRQADAFLMSMLEKDVDTAIDNISTLFCEDSAALFPNNFIKHATFAIKQKGQEIAFKNLNTEKLIKSFWNSENPNVCSIINFWNLYGTDTTFANNEARFVQIISKYITSFKPETLKVLPKVVEAFMSYMNTNNIDISKDIESLDNFFESKSISAIMTTAFLKVANNEICYESTGAIRFIVSTLKLHQSDEVLRGVFSDNNLSKLLQEYTTPQRYTFLLAELARELNDGAAGVGVFERARRLSESSTDPDVLAHCYNACALLVGSCIDPIEYLPKIGDFMMRDFNTANDLVRLALTRLFDALVKRTAADETIQEAAHFFVDRLIGIPWNSRLKKFVMPTLLRYVHPDRADELLATLLKAMEDSTNKPFVAKCISSFAEQREVCLRFLDVVVADAERTKQTAPLISIQALLAPLFRASPEMIEEMHSRVDAVSGRFARTWLRFDLVLAAPRLAKADAFREQLRSDMAYARHSGNWDLKSRSLTVFADAGFPYVEEDCDAFIKDYDDVLQTDSTIQHTAISDAMIDLFKRMSTQSKKFTRIDGDAFLTRILEITAEHMSSSFIPTQREFAFIICSNLWRFFPHIGGARQIALLASLLSDRALDLRQSVISLLRTLKRQQRVNDILVALNSEEVNQFVLSTTEHSAAHLTDADFPRQMEAETLRRFRILLARGDTTIEPSPFFVAEAVPKLVSVHKDTTLEWEVQSEIFGIISWIINKLKNEVDLELIDKTTRYIFDVLFNTRKVGLVMSSIETLERLLKVLYFFQRTSVPSDFAQQLISQLSNFDMAQMRRSAGLPFLTLALIRSEPQSSPLNLFGALTQALFNVVRKSDSATEAANAMNILKAIVNETEASAKCEPLLGEILACVFDACYRFDSWDVLSAVDLTIVAFLRKTCNIGGVDAAASTSIVRVQFFSKISDSRATILKALRSENVHASYMAMVILELFKADTGDDELTEAVRAHIGSRASRVRRIAARALQAVLAINKRRSELESLSANLFAKNWNHFHGSVLAMRAIIEAGGNASELKVEARALNSIPPMAVEDYVFVLRSAGIEVPELRPTQGRFPSDEGAALASVGAFSSDLTARTIVPLLRKWGPKAAPQSLLDFLLARVLCDEVLTMNESFSINATQFLASHLPRDYIGADRLATILSLFSRAHSVALKAALLSLVRFVRDPSIELIAEHAEEFLVAALDLSSREAPVHMALASIADLLLRDQRLLPAVLVLAVNDVPIVRTRVLEGYAAVHECDLPCERAVIAELAAAIGESAREDVGRRWISALERLSESDSWGEPFSLFVDEFFIPKLCLPGVEECVRSLDVMLTTASLRRQFIDTVRRL